ncbi:FadR/GntR family transcriptional regulator [Brevibacterium aurantiacum]|uniref:FadR/GntR family transcriptional regulator n=1 Tax=Brevibacterium aurantiacum TaxID=273384 RepID=UPI001D026DC9|nr:GntR family transcriptional regulator [Brevibacterium aurantiacum]
MTSESVSKDDDTAAGHAPKAPQAPEWKPVSRSSTHELVINAIEEQITSGYLTVGDPLPSERDLAAKLQVSRAAVREALRVMESLGVVVSNVGSGKSAGTFIASMPKEALS